LTYLVIEYIIILYFLREVFLNKNNMNIIKYLRSVVKEFNNVKWPTKKMTILFTLGVMGIATVVIIYLGLLDFAFVELVNRFLI